MTRAGIGSLIFKLILIFSCVNALASASEDLPPEQLCQPYVDKALNQIKSTDPSESQDSVIDVGINVSTQEENSLEDTAADNTSSQDDKDDDDDDDDQNEQVSAGQSSSELNNADANSQENTQDEIENQDVDADDDDNDDDDETDEHDGDNDSQQHDDSLEKTVEKRSVGESSSDNQSTENDDDNDDDDDKAEADAADAGGADGEASNEADNDETDQARANEENSAEVSEQQSGADDDDDNDDDNASKEDGKEEVTAKSEEQKNNDDDNDDDDDDDGQSDDNKSVENKADDDQDQSAEANASADKADDDQKSGEESGNKSAEDNTDTNESVEKKGNESVEQNDEASDGNAADKSEEKDEESAQKEDSKEDDTKESNDVDADDNKSVEEESADKEAADDEDSKDDDDDENPEEDLAMEFEVPKNLRDRKHIGSILKLDEATNKEEAINKAAEIVLRDLKRIYDNAIKPLEQLYKYRDLSNRHFGDPEIFSKPLVLFMGPWSGGKSTILNYLTGNEYTDYSVRSGAEPSPAYFNILMHGNESEVLDGTQLAADWTFSGLQKFGQGMLDRLRGVKIPNKLLEKVNIVEIPGILEVRKQVSRLFPFNDACQWFIDRADIIFLVYDPSKLDVGPETEAILDQLKGREYQTRILLNKADQVKPEELLRVQSALIWNISPLMSSLQPPTMYTVSLWSHPYESGAPVRLLQAQERAFLVDLRDAIDKRIENKIASARRFAVRVRNHAKMVDCYLTTYYNHKTLFGNKKLISQQIIENPQQYHIYEGLSTLTNISRYDLPDPEVYKDFFNLNPLYTFKRLRETCTYFQGCPINKLDVAIAYDLPELGGKYRRTLEQFLQAIENESDKDSNSNNNNNKGKSGNKS